VKTCLLLACSLLLVACSVRPPLNSAQDPAEPSTVILIHGLYANQSYFRPLRTSLVEAGFQTLSPDLSPSDGSLPIEELAAQLETFIRTELPPDTPLQFVGHSMGGLIALHYLKDPSHAARCRALYTIATPHQGTLLANLHGGPVGRQMIANSPFLQSLAPTSPTFPVTTYRSTNDLIIIPNDSATLPFADNQLIASPGHNEILSTPALANDLLNRIRQRDKKFSIPNSQF
jgi:triacylglycerol lipase